MADITFKFKRGSSGGSSPSGLTHGELAVNTTDNRLFVGSVTGSVNAINNRFFTGISTPSYPIEGDRWYTGTVEKFYYSNEWVTSPSNVLGSSGSSFDPTQLLVFNSGVSGSGGATFAGGTRFYGGAIVQSGGLSVTGGATITGGVALYGTITVNGAPISSGIANVPLASSSATGVASFGNEFVVSVTGAVSLTANYVKSVNGSTGAVLSIATTGSNTFMGLQTLNAGLTTTHLYVSGGATFANGLNLLGVGGYQTLSSDASNNLIVNSWNYQSYKVAGIEKLYIGAAGISATGLYVSTGATFANGLVVQAGGISITGGLNVSSGTISGTLATAAQTSITSVGTLTRLDVGSGGISSAGGITGTLNTAAQTSITSVGTLTSLSSSGLVTASGGITSNHLYVSNGVTFAGTSVHTGLGTFNAGITSTHLHVSNGATFASGLVVQAGGISITGGATLTGGVAVYGGLNVSSGTISGTLATAAQTNITSVGTLTRLEVGSGGISSAGGITGTLNTIAQPRITLVGTLTSLTASGLGVFNAGITSTHLHVSNGATFANGLVVQAGGISITGGLNVSSGTISGTLATAAQPNITSVGTLTKLEVGSGGISSAGGITGTLNGNASTATTLATPRTINQTSFNGSSNINIDQMFRADKRHISPTGPSGVPAGYSQFVFTTWNNTLNTTPYADGIHFRTYQDASGGKDNLLMLNKSVIGMRLWQQEFGSATAYTAYKDVAFIQDVVTSFNGLTGAVSGVTTSAANTFTALNTFNGGISVASGATFTGTSFFTGTETKASFNGGLDTNTLYVVAGVTFGGHQGTYHAGLGTFNAGITSSHLRVSNGATFASGLSVTGGTAYFFRDVYLATGANHPGIVDYEFAANTGITYPSASTPAYTVGDKWSNGSIEYTWNGSAWIENTDNIFSSTPIDFNSIVPSQSITPAKLSPGGPYWNSTHFFPGKMSWGSSATDTVELPAGSITAAGHHNPYTLSTRQYVDDAVAGIYNATQTIGPFTVLNAGDNTSLSIPEKFDLNRKYYVNWSVNATNGGDRSFDIYCQAPAGYGITIYPFYNNFIAGKGFSIQFPSTQDTEVSIGGLGGGTGYYADGIDIAIYRIKQTNGGGVVPIQKGCFIYEIVPLLVL